MSHHHDALDLSDDTGDSADFVARRQRVARQSTWISVGVNIVLTVLQLAVGLWARSQALVADALHSLSDLVSDAVVLLAGRHSQKGADENHPYGHQRFETAATLILGLILCGVGAGMLASAVGSLLQPTASLPPVNPLAGIMAVITLVAKEALFQYMLRAAKSVRSGLLVANAWHARSDALSSLVVAIGIAGSWLGYAWFDPLAALIVGLMVLRMGGVFAWDALHDLTDRSADEAEIDAIVQALRETPQVLGVHDVRTRKVGDMIIADAHLEVDGQLTVSQGHDIALSARANVMRHPRILNLMIHLDPHGEPDHDHGPPQPLPKSPAGPPAHGT